MTERTCSVPACAKRAKSRGWCTTHYERWRRIGDVAADVADLRKVRPVRFCETPRCGEPHYAKGLCKPHYRAGYHEHNREHEQATHKAWRLRNAAYQAERWQTWWTVNGPQRNARRRALYAADPAKFCRIAKAWRLHNPGSHKRWRLANPERWALINRENQRRRRRVGGQPVSFREILARDGMVCHLCALPIAGLSGLHFDHVVPLSRGGAHAAENIKPAHAACNLRKSDKLLSELDWVVIRG